MLLPKIKKIPKKTNGRLAIPALAGLLVLLAWFRASLHAVVSVTVSDHLPSPAAKCCD